MDSFDGVIDLQEDEDNFSGTDDEDWNDEEVSTIVGPQQTYV